MECNRKIETNQFYTKWRKEKSSDAFYESAPNAQNPDPVAEIQIQRRQQ